jgi:hypothetical protein
VLALASFAMASKRTMEECSRELNEKMHDLIRYCDEDWDKRSMSGLQITLDDIEKFQIFNSNFIAIIRW